MLLFLKDLVLATLGQMASLFAGIFVFGLLIQLLSQMTYKSLEKAFGNKGVYPLAWLGTPIHEGGHAIFCLIFGHKIAEIKLFKPDPNTGTLGYVYHKWDKKNPWHILGNFFIGIGPVIIGSGVLFGLFYLLIPGSSQAWGSLLKITGGMDNYSVASYLGAWRSSALTLVKQIFTLGNLVLWRFWVFMYLAICISANIRLSWADFKHSLSGLGCAVVPFFLLNVVILLIGAGTFATAVLGAVYGVLILALLMALVGFIFIYAIAAIYYRRRYRINLKPF